MSEAEFQIISWVLALVVCGLSASWLVLVMQAFFHDKRIGFACAFGGAAAALAMAISETLSHALLWSLLAVNMLLIGWFVVRQLHRPIVYMPAIILVLSAAGALWVWCRLNQSGVI